MFPVQAGQFVNTWYLEQRLVEVQNESQKDVCVPKTNLTLTTPG